MKLLRFLSVLICISLLLCIISPLAYASTSGSELLDNVVVDDNYALYIFEDATQKYSIYLNTDTSDGSFAITYISTPDYMYEYLFSLDAEEICTSSPSFWNNLISSCFSHSDQWATIYLPSAISCQQGYSSLTRSTPQEYFNEWLYDKYGSQRTNSIAGYYMRQSQLFVLYETVTYQAARISSYKVNQAISVAGFITGVLGLAAGFTLVSVIGAIAGTAGVIAAGTKIDEYDLSIGIVKNVTVQGGTIIHASASKAIHFAGYVNPDTGFSAVDEGSENFNCHPSEELFEDNTLLVDTAWDHLRNP